MSGVTKAECRNHYQPAYRRLEKVLEQVGIRNLESFNQWAFRQHPMRYDDNLLFLWQNAHSTKYIKNPDTDNVLDEICQLWKDKNTEWPATFFGD